MTPGTPGRHPGPADARRREARPRRLSWSTPSQGLRPPATQVAEIIADRRLRAIHMRSLPRRGRRPSPPRTGPKERPMAREIVLDTETTGFEPKTRPPAGGTGLRWRSRSFVPTGRSFHVYIDPCRDMPAEAEKVHGLSAAFLTGKPKFERSEVVDGLPGLHRRRAADRPQRRLRPRLHQLGAGEVHRREPHARKRAGSTPWRWPSSASRGCTTRWTRSASASRSR